MGFDGIGAPETHLKPEDLSLAVGKTAAVHTANSLARFYKITSTTGLKAKMTSADTLDSSSYLRQIWLADFFYAVRGHGGGCATQQVRVWVLVVLMV